MPGPSRCRTIRGNPIYRLLSLAGLAWLAANAGTTARPEPRDFIAARNHMVDDSIVREGVTNPAVIKAMRTIPRHKFIGKNPTARAYVDEALPIGHGQTISPPFIVAYMTESLDPQPNDKVLEIGTGSGYQAAILSEVVKEVYTIEIVEALGKSAAKILNSKEYPHVHTRIGDGYKGWPEAAPFDKIIVTCSPESVPDPLVEQLREGGKMIVPLGERYEQVFYLFEKMDGKLVKKRLLPALFVPMTGEAEKKRVVLPDPKHPEIHNGSFELDNEGDGHPVGWHYQRQMTLKSGNAPNGQRYVTFNNTESGRNSQMLQAIPVDGRQVSALKISLTVKADKIVRGDRGESACFLVRFYDSERGSIKEDLSQVLGPWQGTFGWTPYSRTVTVPTKAREAIFFLGLGGALGEMSIDDIRISAVPR